MIAFWLVFLSFLMIALETAGLARAITPLQGLVSFLPLLLAAALVLIVGAVLAQFLGRLTQATAASMGVEYHEKFGQAIRWLLLVVTAIVAVEQLGIDLTLITDTLTNLLTIAAASIALAFALGSKDVVRNVLAGFYARELYALGDTLVIDDEEGTLEGISTLNAEVFRGNEKLVIPNSKLIESRVLVRKPTEFEGRKPE
jgi:small-conductance mechanosensitive channel